MSTFSHSSKEVNIHKYAPNIHSLDPTLTHCFSFSHLPGCVDGRIAEKRQEEEEGSADAVLPEEEEGQETRRGLRRSGSSPVCVNDVMMTYYGSAVVLQSQATHLLLAN